MDELEIPIFKKAYELYKEFYACLKNYPKSDRYSLGQKCEITISEVIELLLLASEQYKQDKNLTLQKASVKLNILRVFIRLSHELKLLDKKKYILLQAYIDEVGRMLGGWIKSTREQKSP